MSTSPTQPRRPASGRFGPRRALRLAAALTLLPGCGVRDRPSPVDPTGFLSVEILVPSDGQAVPPGQLDVVVHAHDVTGRLAAVGAVARLVAAPGTLLDSVVIAFPAVTDTTATVSLTLPTVQAPTGLELRGVAFNSMGGGLGTTALSLVLTPCSVSGCN